MTIPDEPVAPGEDAVSEPTVHLTPRTPHVIVVGGGIAGLVTSRALADAGVRVTLVEASDRLGGKVKSHVVGGIRLDAGAESFATRQGTVAALATQLGLGGALVTPASGGAWLYPRSGVAVPLPRAGLLGVPSVPLARDVIAVVGLAGALRAQLDALLSGFVGSRERSFGKLVRRRMGNAVVDRLVTPVAGAIHSMHPDELDVDLVAPRLRAAVLSEGSLAKGIVKLRESAPAGSAVQGLAGGLFQLADALAADLVGRIELVVNASVIDATGTTITLADGTTRDADQIVLATELGTPPGAPISLATLVVDAAQLVGAQLDAAPRGTGVLVAPGAPGVRAKALTHATAKWAWVADLAPGRHVVRLSYETAPALDDAFQELARTDAELLLGASIPAGAVVAFDRVTWTGPAAVDSPVRHSMAPTVDPPTVDAELSSPPDAWHVGERVAGTGLAAVIGHASTLSENLLRELAQRSGLRLN